MIQASRYLRLFLLLVAAAERDLPAILFEYTVSRRRRRLLTTATRAKRRLRHLTIRLQG